MFSDALFHGLFWTLLAGMMGVRILSVVQVRASRGRFMPDRQAIDREGKAAFLVRFLGFFLILGLLVAYALNPAWMRALDSPLPIAARWLGFAFGLVGVALAGWSQVTLGRQWSAQLQLTERHQLITGGPYARIRHPIYAALLSLSLGFALITANWFFILMGAIAIIVALDRIPREERMMQDGVPGYADYATRVRFRLIPGVW